MNDDFAKNDPNEKFIVRYPDNTYWPGKMSSNKTPARSEAHGMRREVADEVAQHTGGVVEPQVQKAK